MAESSPTQARKMRYRLLFQNDGLLAINSISTGLAILCAALGLFVFFEMQADPDPVYFPLTQHQQMIVPKPLNEPGVSEAELLNWVAMIIKEAYSYNYRNAERQHERLSEYLDARGLETYKKLLKSDQNLRVVTGKKYIVSVFPQEAPSILREGVVDGRYAWQIRIPVELSFENASELLKQTMRIDMLIWRVSELEAPVGLKVTRFTTRVTERGTAIQNLPPPPS